MRVSAQEIKVSLRSRSYGRHLLITRRYDRNYKLCTLTSRANSVDISEPLVTYFEQGDPNTQFFHLLINVSMGENQFSHLNWIKIYQIEFTDQIDLEDQKYQPSFPSWSDSWKYARVNRKKCRLLVFWRETRYYPYRGREGGALSYRFLKIPRKG